MSQKIGLVGARGIGKTTLLTAAFDETIKVGFGQVGIVIQAHEEETREILNINKNSLAGILSGGLNFQNRGLGSTMTAQLYDFEMYLASQPDLPLVFQIMDYPGELFKTQSGDAWNACRSHLLASRVIIVPVDASLIMETRNAEDKARIPGLLGLAEAGNIVLEWAASQLAIGQSWFLNIFFGPFKRAIGQSRPLDIILCPVKCEKYFKDNGGNVDASVELYATTLEHYKGIIDQAVEINPGIRAHYLPVDSMGCVEHYRTDWNNDPPKQFFRLREHRRRTVKGAEDLMGIIVENFIHQMDCDAQVKINGNDLEKKSKQGRITEINDQWFLFRWWNSSEQIKLEEEVAQINQSNQKLKQHKDMLQTIRTKMAEKKSGRYKPLMEAGK
ncbi:MAG: hypothetical protein PHQ23_07255 [Candidatus Wallbacteria bacterium]|nr:hypothetical protein [Candidatus Wallbacteria bacterium]